MDALNAPDPTQLQDRVIDASVASLENAKDVLIEAPTGSGKTRMFSKVTEQQAKRGQKVLVLATTQNLVKQTTREIGKWSNNSLAITGENMNGILRQEGDVVVSTVQTAARQLDQLKKYDLVVIDEAHNATDRNEYFNPVLARLAQINPDMRLLTVTATPQEMRQGMHPRIQEADHHVITFEEAAAARLIILPETITPNVGMKEGVKVSDIVETLRKNSKSAEFESGISTAVKKGRAESWTSDYVDCYERHLSNHKTLAFFDSIKDADAFAKEARERGIAIEVVHSKRPSRENEAALASFKTGNTKVIASVDMISEGYDVPAVDGILMCNASSSAKEYRQRIGRATRGLGENRAPGRLVDCGASTFMHGEIGAQAALQTIRGKLDRDVAHAESLLPGEASGSFSPWIKVDHKNDRDIYATAIDSRIIYVSPTEKGYATFASSETRKGAQLEMVAVEGSPRKGMIQPEPFKAWISESLRRNERKLAQMATAIKGASSKLEAVILKDYEKNRLSIARNVELLTMTMPARAAIGTSQTFGR